MLTTDLEATEDKDRAILDKLLQTFIGELKLEGNPKGDSAERDNLSEMQLVVMRLFSVLMSRSKSWQGVRIQSSSTSESSTASTFVSHSTAGALLKSGCIKHSLAILGSLLKYWKNKGVMEAESNVNLSGSPGAGVAPGSGVKISNGFLKAQPQASPPDMSPFFLKQYVKGHAHDVFEAYPQLLTEMALRIPYQVKKITDALPDKEPIVFDEGWFHYLCEYMMTSQTPYVRRQVRKLLLYICGSKEKYRELRDLHSLGSHMKDVREIVSADLAIEASKQDIKSVMSFAYDTLLQLIEHLKACVDISSSRTQNWQKFCLANPDTLSFLFQISFVLDDGVNPIVLQLLQAALCDPIRSAAPPITAASSASSTSSRTFKFGVSKLSSPSKPKPKEEDQDDDEDAFTCAKALVRQVNKQLNKALFGKFIEKFLMECNATSVRWQAHSLIVTLQRNSGPQEREDIVDILWQLWHQLPNHGRKAAQFVDLLGYFSMKTLKEEPKINSYIQVRLHILFTLRQKRMISLLFQFPYTVPFTKIHS